MILWKILNSNSQRVIQSELKMKQQEKKIYQFIGTFSLPSSEEYNFFSQMEIGTGWNSGRKNILFQ